MTRIHRSLAFAVLLGIGIGACAQETALAPENLPEFTPQASMAEMGSLEEYFVVVFTSSRVPGNADRIVADAGGELVATLPQIGVGLATSAESGFASSLGRARSVRAVGPLIAHSLPDVAAIEQIPDPPSAFFDELWGIARVMAPEAWETTTGSHETVLAIIDTGIATNHPDLASNIVHTACFALFTDPCSEYPDLSFHGTHVAGIAAANFGIGVVGVGPNLGLASYNVFELIEVEPGDFAVLATNFAIWSAMLDAAERGFAVINMSLGAHAVRNENAATWVAWNRVANAVTRQGVTIVATAGNAAANLTGVLFHIPGDVTGIINVGATGIRPDPVFPQEDFFDVLAFYSNVGAPVTLVAPGGDCGLPDSCDPATRPANWFQFLVLSSWVDPNPTCAATQSCLVGWAFAAGTSMAAPHVAGVAGLVKDVNPRLNPHQVTARLKQTAQRLGDRQRFGHGMVDADAAVTK